jgi:hypothetical protein
MSNTASLTLYEKAHASIQRLDYFLCGFAGALFAYIGQNYSPHKLENWFYYLMPVALVCLTISLAFGLRRLQISNDVTELNKDVASDSETCISIHAELLRHQESEKPFLSCNILIGENLNAQQLEELKTEKQKKAKENTILAKLKIKRANLHGCFQNIFLITGFLLILASKILQPYFE